MRHEPTPERRGGDGADSPGGQGSSHTLTRSQTRSVAAIEAAEGGGGGVTPADKQDAHNANILWEEPQNDVCTEQVPNHAIVARDLGFTHKRAQTADIELVDLLRAVAHEFGSCNRYQCREEYRGDLQRLDPPAI